MFLQFFNIFFIFFNSFDTVLEKGMGDWDNYFLSLKKYLDYFQASNQIPTVQGYPNVSGYQNISKDELTGLLSWTQLATAIAEKVIF